jgi:hypothetical protein
MNARFKLVLGEKQMDAIISGLAIDYTELEIRLDNLYNEQSADEQISPDIASVKEKMRRNDELRIKLLRMLKAKEGNTNGN